MEKKQTTMMTSSDVFRHVRYDGKMGEVHLTDLDVMFVEKSNPCRKTQYEWPLQAVKEVTIKPVQSSVDILLECDGEKEAISFQMTTAAEAMRFRQRLEAQFKKKGKAAAANSTNSISSNVCKEEDGACNESPRTESAKKVPEPRSSIKAILDQPETEEWLCHNSKKACCLASSGNLSKGDTNNTPQTIQTQENKGNIPAPSFLAPNKMQSVQKVAGKSKLATSNLDVTEPPVIGSIATLAAVPIKLRRGTSSPVPTTRPKHSPLTDGLSRTSHHKSRSRVGQTGASATGRGGLELELLTKIEPEVLARRQPSVSDTSKNKERLIDNANGLMDSLSSEFSQDKGNNPATKGPERLQNISSNEIIIHSNDPLNRAISSLSDSSAHRLSRERQKLIKEDQLQAQILANKECEDRRLFETKQQQHVQATATNTVVDHDRDMAVESVLQSQKDLMRREREAVKCAPEQRDVESKRGNVKSAKSAEQGKMSRPSLSQVTIDPSRRHHHHTGDRCQPAGIVSPRSFLSFANLLVEATAIEVPEEEEEEQQQHHHYVTPTTVVASQVDMAQVTRQRRKLLGFSLLGCGVVLAVAIYAIVAATTSGGNDTHSPVPTLSAEERSSLFLEGIRSVVFDEDSLSDANSPQSRALHWLTMEDTYRDDLGEVDSGLLEKLEQRYTLAVFYFSMIQASPWQYCQPPETGEEMACIHPVLEFYSNEGIYFDQRMSEPAFRWLSGVDECRWAGITCTDGMHVSKLQLAGYTLQSTLPAEVGFLRNLKVLDLQHNSLVGTLPAEWGELLWNNSAIESIRLDQNKLTGSIPTDWCQLDAASIKSVVLSNNHITGTIPSCLSNFFLLESFSVMNNQLSGTVPDLGTLLQLQTFHVSGNNLSGKFPDSLCNLKRYALKEASADCNNILSENYVQCSCCTTCCDGSRIGDCVLRESMLGDGLP